MAFALHFHRPRRVSRRELLAQLDILQTQVAENRNVIIGLRTAMMHIDAYARPEPGGTGAAVVNLPKPGRQRVVSAAGREWVAVAGEGAELDPRELAAVLEDLEGHHGRTLDRPYGEPA